MNETVPPLPYTWLAEPVLATATGDTIAALATPAGAAALALIRISGPGCRDVAAAAFERPVESLPERRPVYARYRAHDGAVLDDLVWTFLPGPRTATGEDCLELSCHGNPLIVRLILADLLVRGCRAAEPGEFTKRAFLSGRLELTQAEAVMDLIHAGSERALAAARRQLEGGLGRELEALVSELLGVLSRIEAYIDFPDEDLPPEDRAGVAASLDFVLRGTKRLLGTHRFGDLLRNGVGTVLLGAPNAGKSSLLNALVGRQRALVSAEPGTTRDYLEERIQVGPHLLRLIDTAGLNPNPGELERLGIAKTLECLAHADLIVWVIDSGAPVTRLAPEHLVYLDPSKTVVAMNKADLGRPAVALPYPALFGISVSALTGDGIEAFREAIVAKIDSLAPSEAGSEGVVVNARHAEALRRVNESLVAALAGLAASRPSPIELVSSDVRGALDALGEIVGRVDNERMLDALFAHFCIGK